MNRIIVVGSTGAGKTTVASALASKLDLPQLELDSVAHRGGFSDEPQPHFVEEVTDFARQPGWVIDGNYASWGTAEFVWPRADTFVWPDLPRRTVMYRVTRRTVKRTISREELWDGVKEPWSNFYSLDPYKNLMVWAWTRYEHVVEQLETAMANGTWDHARVYRLRSQVEVDEFLSDIKKTTG